MFVLGPKFWAATAFVTVTLAEMSPIPAIMLLEKSLTKHQWVPERETKPTPELHFTLPRLSAAAARAAAAPPAAPAGGLKHRRRPRLHLALSIHLTKARTVYVREFQSLQRGYQNCPSPTASASSSPSLTCTYTSSKAVPFFPPPLPLILLLLLEHCCFCFVLYDFFY